jgi:hypothetical protein
MVNEGFEVWIFVHLGRGDDSAVSGVAGAYWLVGAADYDLANHALDTICTKNDIGVELLSRFQGYLT